VPEHVAIGKRRGFSRLVRDIRIVERARGDGIKRVYDSEHDARAPFRGVSRPPAADR